MSPKIAAVLIFVALLLGCSGSTSFSNGLQRLAAQQVGRSIKIDVVVASAWDEFAIFGPYFPKEEACQILELSTWSCFWLPYAKSDDSSPKLVVFLNKKEIVLSAFLPKCGAQLRPYDSKIIRSPRRQGAFEVATDPSCTAPNYVLKQQ